MNEDPKQNPLEKDIAEQSSEEFMIQYQILGEEEVDKLNNDLRPKAQKEKQIVSVKELKMRLLMHLTWVMIILLVRYKNLPFNLCGKI